MTDTIPLSAAGAVVLLQASGFAGRGTTAHELAGGVSSTVVLVEDGADRWVVKQALPRLKVSDEWLAKQERVLTEAAALELAGSIVPGAVPQVLGVVPDQFAMILEAAPARWVTWKEQLMRGEVDLGVASRLGALLGTWHSATADRRALLDDYVDVEALEQLRVWPYHRTVAERCPDLAREIARLVEEILSARRCLVHGDFSPKNVLVGPDGEVWVLDWEVAHAGEPCFDLAFLTTHLVLKAIHTGAGAACAEAGTAFLDGYRSTSSDLGVDDDRLARHVGGLLLARVHGRSPADYLDAGGRNRADLLGRSLLVHGDLSKAWEATA